MPTLNPRVNVTLSPSLDRLVVRLAKHQRVSKSQVLRELLEAAEPALRRAVSLMDAASRAGPGVLAGLRDSMTRAQEHIEDVLAGTLLRVDDAAVPARARVPGRPAARPDGAGSAPKGPNPRGSNRGVRSHQNGAKGGKGTRS